MWDEYYTEDLVLNGGTAQTMKGPVLIKGMKEKIGDNFMVVNSYEAVKRWGWGYPLIHGMDADEYFDLPKEPRVVLAVSPGGLDKYYNRELITAIKGAVFEKTGLSVMHIQVNVAFGQDNFYQYRNYIGSSLINISPYKDSPMPRSRTEAMLSGSCVLSSKYHGADEFIEHGVDGFIVPDNPLSYATAIHHLINGSYKDAVEIGHRGKKKAKKLFNIERYHGELYDLIVRVSDGEKPKWDGKKLW
jgi:glycosyltransferase involved in cell wall biosynthesis